MRRRDTPAWVPGLVGLLAVLALAWVFGPQTRGPDLELPAEQPASREPDRRAQPDPTVRATARLPAFLPPEAHDTLALIAAGGPFPHRQDGSTFGNRERLLPARERGWYREYTVRTPGSRDRGARRIVTGGDPPSEYWYTDDHYRSFRPFEVPR
jgi:guanyl-specific ribonuclease Sa